ncbi:MAG: cytochrome P450 [Marinosulfonomonas sp.]|nr:cytochrome P450 [Marinosulfonomonas sp.]
MISLSQSPTDPQFVQDPYAFYETARQSAGGMFHWQEYDLPCALSYGAVWAILRDRRFGRQAPPDKVTPHPEHQADFWRIEDHSMLELEPPRHTRLRGLVLRAFTSRRIGALEPEITQIAHDLLDSINPDGFDVIADYATPIPVIIIARLLGVPENHADQLLNWSHAMVGMYQARRTHADEVAAATAAREFSTFITDVVKYRRQHPADDLITHLIGAEEDGKRLSPDELVTTCILLLNAGHEATVHTIGNGIAALLQSGNVAGALTPDQVDATVDEILRYDPPLHMFQRWAYEDVEIGRHTIAAGTKVACLLGAANRDPDRWSAPDTFDPFRPVQTHVSFGAGTHFCIGAPLARLEMRAALSVLFQRHPGLRLAQTPTYSNKYHFHGLKELRVKAAASSSI